MPPALKTACKPLLEQIKQINQTIATMDKQIDELDKKYPEIAILRTVPGVGPVVAACYACTLDSPEGMATNRQAVPFSASDPGSSSQGTPIRSAALPSLEISTCAAYWCSLRNTSCAALDRTLSYAAGG